MQNVDIWEWDTPSVHSLTLAICVVFTALLFCVLCILSLLLCRKSVNAPKDTTLPSTSQSPCGRSAEFIISEVSPRIDPVISKALAVERLLQRSYVFDTRVMGRPDVNVHVVAAKRDYI
ncbi:unnamed protein product [Heligmosomoides polygyrus]|uniref:Transmembrane protein 98 n=1 Tax=Heligmosomoides polygyrus TaxID=6339 RepID=A0A183GGC4_HELPZ|nr:unnamed protein product [Heligmosomoides polygyrus]